MLTFTCQYQPTHTKTAHATGMSTLTDRNKASRSPRWFSGALPTGYCAACSNSMQ